MLSHAPGSNTLAVYIHLTCESDDEHRRDTARFGFGRVDLLKFLSLVVNFNTFFLILLLNRDDFAVG